MMVSDHDPEVDGWPTPEEEDAKEKAMEEEVKDQSVKIDRSLQPDEKDWAHLLDLLTATIIKPPDIPDRRNVQEILEDGLVEFLENEKVGKVLEVLIGGLLISYTGTIIFRQWIYERIESAKLEFSDRWEDAEEDAWHWLENLRDRSRERRENRNP